MPPPLSTKRSHMQNQKLSRIPMETIVLEYYEDANPSIGVWSPNPNPKEAGKAK
jgi:hypothetical protein